MYSSVFLEEMRNSNWRHVNMSFNFYEIYNFYGEEQILSILITYVILKVLFLSEVNTFTTGR